MPKKYEVLKNILLFGTSILGSYLFAGFFSSLYLLIFPGSGGSDIDVSGLIGLPLAYIFSLFSFFITFGDQKKYWWIAIALLPAVLFELTFDLRHIYFPIAIGLVGWAIGRGVEMGIKKFRKV